MLYKVRVPRCGVFGQTGAVRDGRGLAVIRSVLRELPQCQALAVAGTRFTIGAHWTA